MTFLLRKYLVSALHTDVVLRSQRASFRIYQSLADGPYTAEKPGFSAPYCRQLNLADGFV